jgi:hypothetical protein
MSAVHSPGHSFSVICPLFSSRWYVNRFNPAQPAGPSEVDTLNTMRAAVGRLQNCILGNISFCIQLTEPTICEATTEKN